MLLRMKKLGVAILALLFISTSTGAELYMHYCMGKMADWGFGHNDSKTCSGCGMEKSKTENNGCCKDEHTFLKNNTDQKIAEAAFELAQVMAVALPASFIEMAPGDFHSVTEENPVSHAPPRSCGVAVYIRNRVFLI
jgi:hypothetical protein